MEKRGQGIVNALFEMKKDKRMLRPEAKRGWGRCKLKEHEMYAKGIKAYKKKREDDRWWGVE